MPRIHILGASGSGTTTLGAAVAQSFNVPHADTDAIFWLPTEPPFTAPRPLDARLAMLLAEVPSDGNWVLSGSAINWAKPLEASYELIVYLYLDPAERMARLRARERLRYGDRIAAGGDMVVASAVFLAWAAAYDSAGMEQRSRVAHEAWLAAQDARVLRLDSARPVNELVAEVIAGVEQPDRPSRTGGRL